MKDFWNERYSATVFAYGETPNVFFKQELMKLKSGSLLLPADGEGRNSVYASKNKWHVFACDISESGKEKAELLASKMNTKINYQVGDFGQLTYKEESFDAVGLIYAHFPPNKRAEFHQLATKYLKTGGTVIIEAFSKNHLKYNSKNPLAGGPKKVEMLFSIEELKADFVNFNISLAEEVEIELSEGEFHIGKASVVRFVATKK